MRQEFSPDEFIQVWKNSGSDRPPFPLRLQSDIRWRDDYLRAAAEIEAKIPVRGDPSMMEALRVAANPETTLTLSGANSNPIRVYGAIAGDSGVTLVQRPGPTPEVGGNVILQLGSHLLPGKVFAAILGTVPAGQRRPLAESLDRIEMARRSPMFSAAGDTVAEQMYRLVSAPRTGAGHIEVRNLRTGANPTYLSWLDVDGDGRYVYRQQPYDLHIMPSTPEALRKEVNRMAGIAA